MLYVIHCANHPDVPGRSSADLGILQFENWADPLADLQQSPTGATSARL